MSVSQKDGVFACVEAFMSETGRPFEEGMEVKLDRDERKTVIAMLVASTNAGEIDVKSPKARLDLPDYWNGCLSNWLRKDTRLNGGSAYVTKNPGSRAGAGDKQLKALKGLLAKVKGTENEAVVQGHIKTRETELAALKAKTVTIDIDQIPEELRHLILPKEES